MTMERSRGVHLVESNRRYAKERSGGCEIMDEISAVIVLLFHRETIRKVSISLEIPRALALTKWAITESVAHHCLTLWKSSKTLD